MPFRGTVEASLNQLKYHSEDAHPQLFHCSASAAIPQAATKPNDSAPSR
jgi:hypothetical protein